MAVKFELPFTQNSHIVAFICTLIVAITISPYGFGEDGFQLSGHVIIRLVHLSTFAIWLGMQVWVTFVAGVTMYRHLPRHTFGYIQSKLFPKYFLLGTILSSVTFLTFVVEHPFSGWGFQEKVQGYSLGISMLGTVVNLLYFEPQTTKIMFEKHIFEKEEGAGGAVGKIVDEKLAVLNKIEKYVKLSKKFVWMHTGGSLTNLLALSAQAIHLWHLIGHLDTI